ncbi:hypothetical protein KUTeg_003976 [Tegillarca granosa]|uniref:Uncharacterized protein n=1 Tax=Tegillarca granosa TaxID=220873 RepID=A0ABQ9FT51_TEGGR|nr:hypothetical protein KUTeg_003976 [Tegillarca granosa]
MRLCGDAPARLKFGLVLMIAGLCVFIGGFASINWMVSETVREKTDLTVGLFNIKNCSDSDACLETSVDNSVYATDIFKAVKYMECILLVLFTVITAFYAVYVCAPKARSRCFAITIIACTFALIRSITCIRSLDQPFLNVDTFFFTLWVDPVVLALVAATLIMKDVRANDSYYTKHIAPSPAPNRVNLAETSFNVLPSPEIKKKKIPDTHGMPPSPMFVGGAKRWPKYPTTPSPPDTPSTITKFMYEEKLKSKTYRSPPPSYHSTSSRRYGTPKAVTRYDSKAR